jgi:pimeloyl-ACP methyl ester carboxylesterase
MRTETIVVPSNRTDVQPRTDVRGVRPERTAAEGSPFPTHGIEIDGRSIRYIDEGGGPVLLFVDAGAGTHLWREVIVRLRDRFRCVALGVPGFTPPRVLESFVRRLDLRDVTLVLHGPGGPVALGAAPRLHDRIRAFVVTESLGWPLHEDTPEPLLGDRPLLLVFGEESPAVGAGVPERWRERFPDAALLVVEGGRSFPMTDDPELVARAIRGWWREEVLAA